MTTETLHCAQSDILPSWSGGSAKELAPGKDGSGGAIPWRPSLVANFPLLLSGLTLLTFALRMALFHAFPLREDEAIYSFWARMVGQDPWFLFTWPDKPPLFLWLQAGSLTLFGASAAAARALSIAASMITTPVTALIARRLWGDRAGLLAAVLLALSPFAISFGPTAYTDSLLVLFGMAALCCALHGQPLWAGVWLGAAIMTKQQGILYAPLILGCVALWPERASDAADEKTSRTLWLRGVGWCALGLLTVVAPILLWDRTRWAVAPSPWDLSVRNYGPLRLTPLHDWPQRLVVWGQLAWWLTASWPVWGVLAVLIVARLVAERRCSRLRLTPGALLALWSLLFFAMHVVTTVQPWDRYLLPLAPLLALAIARLATTWLAFTPTRLLAALIFIMLILLPPAINAARGGLPVGADHGDLAGLDEALTWVERTLPAEKTLYHRTLGWHAQFYLFDQVQTGNIDLRWFPSAAYLADNAVKTPHRRKFLIEPDWATTRDLSFHLATRSIALRDVARFGRFTVYELTQPAQKLCAWCVSRPPGGWLWVAAP